MATKKQPVTRWFNGNTPIEDLAPSELIAHQLVTEFGDLQPSVVRIMEADLNDDQREKALTAFRDSLGKIGDPNRDPRQAIANALGRTEQAVTGEATDVASPNSRQCGRCRQFFPVEAGTPSSALRDWWACTECHAALIPQQGGRAGDAP